MTAPAIAQPTCPVCSGQMWDQKNGKYPWKPGTPIFKCRDKECASNGGVIWEPKNGAAKPFPKAPPAKVAYNTPKALPNEFDGYRQEETAELNAHTGRGVVDDGLGALMAQCVLDSFAAWNSAMAKYSDVGYSGDNVQGSANTLFIARKDRMPRAV